LSAAFPEKRVEERVVGEVVGAGVDPAVAQAHHAGHDVGGRRHLDLDLADPASGP